MSLLDVQDLSVGFHTRHGVVKAVNRVSFSLEPGGALGLAAHFGFQSEAATTQIPVGWLRLTGAYRAACACVFAAVVAVGVGSAFLGSPS